MTRTHYTHEQNRQQKKGFYHQMYRGRQLHQKNSFVHLMATTQKNQSPLKTKRLIFNNSHRERQQLLTKKRILNFLLFLLRKLESRSFMHAYQTSPDAKKTIPKRSNIIPLFTLQILQLIMLQANVLLLRCAR